MPKRLTVGTIKVQREGKAYHPKIGRVFNYTQEELDHLDAQGMSFMTKDIGAIGEEDDGPVVKGTGPKAEGDAQDAKEPDAAGAEGGKGGLTVTKGNGKAKPAPAADDDL